MKQLVLVALVVFLFPGLQLQQDDDAPENTQALTHPLLTPQQALESIKLPEGFRASLFASEPEIRQPIAMTYDGRGRLWVAECLTYAESKRNFDTRYRDRILIFEDTDGDGIADNRTVFWEGGQRLTGLEVGMGGVWVTCAPEFLFIPDRNHDDIPDGPPEVLLDGWNADFVRHNLVNGVKFGPDGWLYGRHGIQATSHVGPPGSTDSQRVSLNCCIWRFHPVSRTFEVVCEGTTNPWGHDWDQHGELFMINTVIGHLWHVVPGARYRRMYGSHFNPYTYEPIEQTADHFHFSGKEKWSEVNRHGISEETSSLGGGHAHCGMMIYQGDSWPKQYRGGLFTANFHGRRINQESLHRDGNGYTGKHQPDFMTTSDLWFRGVEMAYGPRGEVHLLDWSDIGECHENDGVHRTSGRIYTLAYSGSQTDSRLQTESAAPSPDLYRLNNTQLIQLLDHDNRWYPRTARKVLQERALDPQSWAEISAELDQRTARIQNSNTKMTFESESQRVNYILQTIWTRMTIGLKPVAVDEKTDSSPAKPILDSHPHPTQRSSWNPLTDPNEHVRVWAIKSGIPFEELKRLASDDPSGLVRLHVASQMQNLGTIERFEIAKRLCQHKSDRNDRTQSKLIWYLLEPAVTQHPHLALELVGQSQLPHLRKCIARRLSAEVESHPEWVEQLLELAANTPNSEEILAAITDSLTGRRMIKTPGNWNTVKGKLESRKQAELNDALAFLGTLFGSGVSTRELMAIAKDGNRDPLIRRQAIKAVGESQPENLFRFLQGLLRDRSVAVQVVKSMANCNEDEVATQILNSFATFDLETERSAITTLCKRPAWASRLLNGLKNQRIPKSRVTASHARQIKSLNQPGLNQLLKTQWGVIKDSSEDRLQMMQRIESIVERKDIAPDLSHGRKMFTQHCANCHVLNGTGGHRGPDLTGSDRSNLAYLLENIIDPSASVADTYRSSILLTEDGQTLIGVVTEETENTLKLLMTEEELVIDKDRIEGRRSTTKSLMPDGLLDKMSDQEIADLFGYLRTKSP